MVVLSIRYARAVLTAFVALEEQMPPSTIGKSLFCTVSMVNIFAP